MDKNRLDALFSGLTRAKDSEDKQQTEQESTDNGQGRQSQSKAEEV